MSRRRLLECLLAKTLLPKEYQEVEYIESHGKEYIDSGVLANVNTRIKTSFVKTSSQYGVVIGTNSNAINYKRMWLDTSINITVGDSLNNSIIQNAEVNVKYNIDVLLSTYLSTYLGSSTSLFVFANNQPTVSYYSSIKLYSCKLYDKNVLIRDFIPVYRKSDNEIGLYDLVNKTFYTNIGTGTFAKGNDIV